MNIGIIGSGGREHSICFKLNQSPKVNKIYCIPGNAGTLDMCENITIDINDFEKLYEEIINKKINLIIVGPEVPLVEGIVDYFENKKIKVFGPNKKASLLEGSKAFMKKMCKDYKIPTALYEEIVDIKPIDPKIMNGNFNHSIGLVYRKMPNCYFEIKSFSFKSKKFDKDPSISWNFDLKDMTI